MEPNECPTLGPCLVAANEAWIDQHGAEGPDALQVLIKAPMVLRDLEGCGPSQPRNPMKAQRWPRPCCGKQSSPSTHRQIKIHSGALCPLCLCGEISLRALFLAPQFLTITG